MTATIRVLERALLASALYFFDRGFDGWRLLALAALAAAHDDPRELAAVTGLVRAAKGPWVYFGNDADVLDHIEQTIAAVRKDAAADQ